MLIGSAHSISSKATFHRGSETTAPSATIKDLGILNDKIRPSKKKDSISSSKQRVVRLNNTAFVRVKAIHAAQTMDVIKVLRVFGQEPKRHMFSKTGVFVELSSETDDESRFVAVFRYGSVVMFNIYPGEAGKLLERIKEVCASGPVSAGFERKEHFEMVIDPHFQQDNSTREEVSAVNGDFCIVPKLDMNSVAIVGAVMGQTVALDSYNDTVDELLANFMSINATVTQTGYLNEINKSALFQVVSMNNSIFIDMVSKLGIKDRSDMAWNMSQYEQVHQVSKPKQQRFITRHSSHVSDSQHSINNRE